MFGVSPLTPLPSWEQRALCPPGGSSSCSLVLVDTCVGAGSRRSAVLGMGTALGHPAERLGTHISPLPGPGSGPMAPFRALPSSTWVPALLRGAQARPGSGGGGRKHPLISSPFVQTHEPSWSRRAMPPAGKPQRRGGCPASVSFPAGVAGPARQMAPRLAETSAGARSSWLHPYPGQERRC